MPIGVKVMKRPIKQTSYLRATLKGMANPYGDGRAAPRIAEVLRTVPLDARLIQKRFAEEGVTS